MSERLVNPPTVEAASETPSDPDQIASAARSCLVILMGLTLLVLIACVLLTARLVS